MSPLNLKIIFAILCVWLTSAAHAGDGLFADQMRSSNVEQSLAAHKVSIAEVVARHSAHVIYPEGVRFREKHNDQGKLAASFALVTSMLKDFDQKTELLILIRETETDGNLHAALLVRGIRYDGGWFRQESSPPRENNLVDRGLMLRYQGVPAEDLDRLESALTSNPRIREFNCYSSLLKLIESKSGLRLARPYPNLPLFPSEHVGLMLDGKLGNPKLNVWLTPKVYSTGKFGFEKTMEKLVASEVQSAPDVLRSCSTMVRGLVIDDLSHLPDYRAVLGLTY